MVAVMSVLIIIVCLVVDFIICLGEFEQFGFVLSVFYVVLCYAIYDIEYS